MEIVPGIHQLQVPIPNNPLAGLNAYLVQGEEGWLLVDAGWDCDEAFNALERQLDEKGLGFNAISQIIITHAHPDHYGLMGRITRCSGARSALHQADCALIEAVAQDRVGRAKRHADQLKANGVPEEELRTLAGAFVAAANTVRYLDQPDVVLHGGEKISTGVFDLEVIFTPGHCPGHICLYERNRRILFSGDHILPKITPHVNMVPYYADNPLAIFIDSLKKVDHFSLSPIAFNAVIANSGFSLNTLFAWLLNQSSKCSLRLSNRLIQCVCFNSLLGSVTDRATCSCSFNYTHLPF